MSNIRTLRNDGLYHVYNRGNDKMILFPKDIDKLIFLRKLKKLQEIYSFEIFIYCLMSNHYHIMIKDSGISLSSVMNCLQTHYSKYFNAKYNHSGHVFEGPYKSKLVFGYKSFFRLFRYIGRNPVVAKIVKAIKDYRWVSIDLDHDVFGLVNFSYTKEYYKEHSTIPFSNYLENTEDDDLITELESYRMDDSDAKEVFSSIIYNLTEGEIIPFSELNASTQFEVIYKSRYKGLTLKQMTSFTGLSKYRIQRIIKTQPYEYI